MKIVWRYRIPYVRHSTGPRNSLMKSDGLMKSKSSGATGPTNSLMKSKRSSTTDPRDSLMKSKGSSTTGPRNSLMKFDSLVKFDSLSKIPAQQAPETA